MAGPAGRLGAGAAAGAASFFACLGSAGDAGAGGGAGGRAGGGGGAGAAAVGAAAGVASAPHWALRKSFHFMVPSEPSFLAAWYFALHSCEVSACAGALTISAAKPDTATAHNNID